MSRARPADEIAAARLGADARDRLGGLRRRLWWRRAVRSGLLVLAVALFVTGLLLIFFVLRPLLKTASGGANVPALANAGGVPVTQLQTTVIGPDGQPQLAQLTGPASEMEQRIDIARIEGQVKASSVKKVADFVQSNPDDAAGILRTWVAEG